MKKKIKKYIKQIIHKLDIEDCIRCHVMNIRKDKISSLSKDQKISKLKKWYFNNTGKSLCIENPQSFNEKIQWLKINDFNEEKVILSDKYSVRNWIKKTIGEKYLIPIYGVWDDANKINFERLPKKFVLKSNHGSGMNLIVDDKSKINHKKVIKKLNYWLNTPYDPYGMEQQYFSIPRKIIAEKYIEQQDGDLIDYKIHCFNGTPKLIHVIGNRNLKEHTAKEACFDLNWNNTPVMYKTYEQYDILPKKPEKLNEMLQVAEKLSKNFKYVRIDLYMIENEIKFGEITFTPASGIGKFENEKNNELLGSWIKL